MQPITTIHAVRQLILPWRRHGDTVILVPTMGALHRGHMALVEHGLKIAARVIVSIFVNPKQFGDPADLNRYPRTCDADQKMLEQAGCDLLFLPDAEEIYPPGFATSIDPGPMAEIFEGAARPGHFQGVATVVTKLLMQIMPDAVLFGEKDYQQLCIIRRVTRDLDIPVHIIPCPTLRDEDGLALSSRNVFLSPEERRRAVALPQSLLRAAEKIRLGGDVAAAVAEGRATMTGAGFAVDYFDLVDSMTLERVTRAHQQGRLLAAGQMGSVRLIDNVAVET